MYQIRMDEKLLHTHYSNVKEYIREKVEENRTISFSEKGMADQYELFLDDLLTEDSDDEKKEPLWDIICGTPEHLLKIFDKWEVLFAELERVEQEESKSEEQTGRKKKHQKRLEKIFDYNWFVEKKTGAYALTRALNVRVCPYCNQAFTYTIFKPDEKKPGKEKPMIRPELDHYFPKSKYPMFALSIYNLIPCCHNCNSVIKGSRELNKDECYHPYIPEEIAIRFSFTRDGEGQTAIKVNCDTDKAKNTAEFFELDALYQQHIDESNHIFELYEAYPDAYVEELLQVLQMGNVRITKDKLLKMIYDHYQIGDADAAILGQLRSDLYKQIQAMYPKKCSAQPVRTKR